MRHKKNNYYLNKSKIQNTQGKNIKIHTFKNIITKSTTIGVRSNIPKVVGII